jgi:hypothetical protein
MILDYEFTHLYESLESSILCILTEYDINLTDNLTIVPISIDSCEQQILIMMVHYNDLIRQRDEQINIYKEKEEQWIEERDINNKKIKDLEQQLQKIKDKYGLLNN